MTTTRTSREALRLVNTNEQEEVILALMRKTPEATYCIADAARALGWEKSTVSARMNSLKSKNLIEDAGTFPSHSTGIRSQHYKVKLQDSLFAV